MQKNMVQRDRPQIIWRMCLALWITKATNTHAEYVILIANLLQEWLNERASMLHYMYTACLVISRVKEIVSLFTTKKSMKTERLWLVRVFEFPYEVVFLSLHVQNTE